MLRASMNQCGALKKVFSTIKDLIDEANLNWNDDGVSFQAMDSSHIALVSVFLQGSGFDEYLCEKKTTLGLSFKSMDLILSTLKNEEKLVLSSSKDSDELCFDCRDKKGGFSTKFKMKLLDIDSEYLQIEDCKHDVEINMKSSDLRDLCKRFERMAGTDVEIKSLDNGSIQLTCNGDVTSSETVINPSETTSIKIKQNVYVSYSLKYLLNFVKGSCFNCRVSLAISNESPLVVKYIIDDENCKGTVHFYLAPKNIINDDDDD